MDDDRKKAPRREGGPGRDRKAKDGIRKPSGDRGPAKARADAGAVEVGDGRERIAKRLARAGVASRREAEMLIAAGRIRVNGKVLDSPAVNVGPADRIEIDNEPIPVIERTRLFLFHKPAGVVTTNRDPQGRRTVFDVLPEGLPRLVTVGRLDINTEGLLLLTNDGGLARILELPQTGWLRRYRVRVHGEVDEAALAGLKQGIAVDGVFYGAIEATLERRQGTNAWLSVGLREGKNREVKNVMAKLGLEVTRLIRVSYGPFQLGELGEGQVRELKGRMLRDQLGPRLIEEAGANFDAPVSTPFSPAADNVAPARSENVRGGRDDSPRERRPAPAPREEAGGLIRNRKRDRNDKRESALSRLSTSTPARGFKGQKGGKRDDDTGRDDKRGPQGRRTANVWMAPGARPGGARKPVPTTDEGGESPKRQFRPRPEGDGPKREWKPRPSRSRAEGEEPTRDWKARPPRADEADRPKREWKPRPPRGEGETPKREWKPRAASADGETPKREWKPRPPRSEQRQRSSSPPVEGRPEGRGDAPKPYHKREAGSGAPRKTGGKPAFNKPGGKPGAGKGPGGSGGAKRGGRPGADRRR